MTKTKLSPSVTHNWYLCKCGEEKVDYENKAGKFSLSDCKSVKVYKQNGRKSIYN